MADDDDATREIRTARIRDHAAHLDDEQRILYTGRIALIEQRQDATPSLTFHEDLLRAVNQDWPRPALGYALNSADAREVKRQRDNPDDIHQPRGLFTTLDPGLSPITSPAAPRPARATGDATERIRDLERGLTDEQRNLYRGRVAVFEQRQEAIPSLTFHHDVLSALVHHWPPRDLSYAFNSADEREVSRQKTADITDLQLHPDIFSTLGPATAPSITPERQLTDPIPKQPPQKDNDTSERAAPAPHPPRSPDKQNDLADRSNAGTARQPAPVAEASAVAEARHDPGRGGKPRAENYPKDRPFGDRDRSGRGGRGR